MWLGYFIYIQFNKKSINHQDCDGQILIHRKYYGMILIISNFKFKFWHDNILILFNKLINMLYNCSNYNTDQDDMVMQNSM